MRHDFQPIAERELRAAARRKSTFRMRCWTALLATLASFLTLPWLPMITAPAGFASPMFGVQTACAFGFALLAGAFLTSDCLSEEKRDGTLGLLFLTELRAGNIVLGKFAAMTLNAIYGLMALVPIMAVPIMLGGVTLSEFWRMALALANTLFFSLALGLCVSAFVTDYSRGLGITLALLALFGAVLPAIAEFGPPAGMPSAWAGFAWLSPFYPFYCARDTVYVLQPAKFWTTLLASHSIGWLCLPFASSALTRGWRDWAAGLKRSGRLRRQRHTERLRPLTGPHSDDRAFDPVVRLTGDASILRWAAWLIVGAWGALVGAKVFWPNLGPPGLLGAIVCAFLFKALVAFQACRFFVETRRSGALELLLCTPLRSADLVRAQWRALIRVFGWPLILFLGLSWATVVLPFGPALTGLAMSGASGSLPGMSCGFPGAFFLTLGLAADILATGWFGMWLALTVKKPGTAPGLTILAVLILPALLYRLDLVADMLFISWGTTRFQREFRWLAALSDLPRESRA